MQKMRQHLRNLILFHPGKKAGGLPVLPVAENGATHVHLREKIPRRRQQYYGHRAFRLHDLLLFSRLIMLKQAAGSRQK
jgi:hypothetical protein